MQEPASTSSLDFKPLPLECNLYGAEPPASSPPSPQSGPSPVLLISASPAAASTPCPIHQSRRLGITFAFSRFCRFNNSAKIARLWLPPCPHGIFTAPAVSPSAQALISGHPDPARSRSWGRSPLAHPCSRSFPCIEPSMAPLGPQDETLTTGPELTPQGCTHSSSLPSLRRCQG